MGKQEREEEEKQEAPEAPVKPSKKPAKDRAVQSMVDGMLGLRKLTVRPSLSEARKGREDKEEKERLQKVEKIKAKFDPVRSSLYDFRRLHELGENIVPYLDKRFDAHIETLNGPWFNPSGAKRVYFDFIKLASESSPKRVSDYISGFRLALEKRFESAPKRGGFYEENPQKEDYGEVLQELFRVALIFGNASDLPQPYERKLVAEIFVDGLSSSMIQAAYKAIKNPEDKKDFFDKLFKENRDGRGSMEGKARDSIVLELVKLVSEIDQINKILPECLLCEKKVFQELFKYKDLFNQDSWRLIVVGGLRLDERWIRQDDLSETMVEAVGNLSDKTLDAVIRDSDFKENQVLDLILNSMSDRKDITTEAWGKVLLFLAKKDIRDSFVKENFYRLSPAHQKEISEIRKFLGVSEFDSNEPNRPSAKLIERFRAGQTLSELWAELYTPGELGGEVVNFGSFKEAVGKMMVDEDLEDKHIIDERSPEEISKFIKENKDRITKVMDKKILEDRESGWGKGGAFLRSQGLSSIDSVRDYIEALAKKQNKTPARLAEKDFADTPENRAAVKEWKVEVFGKRFSVSFNDEIYRLHREGAEGIKGIDEIREEIEKEFERKEKELPGLVDKMISSLKKIGGSKVKIKDSLRAELIVNQRQENSGWRDKALDLMLQEGIKRREEVEGLQKKLGDYLSAKGNKNFDLTEGVDGEIYLSGVVDFGEEKIEIKSGQDFEAFANEVYYLLVGEIKDTEELLREAEPQELEVEEETE